MVQEVAVLMVVASIVLGPVAWIVWRDHVRQRGLAVRAEVQSLVNRALGGESLVTVEVVEPVAWRTGRVILSAPRDWRWLIDTVSPRVLDRLPRGYELVIRHYGAPRASVA